MTDSISLLYCPFPTLEAARTAATQLLEQRLVACCNLIPIAESLYWWEGKLATNPETLLIAKTLPSAHAKAHTTLEALHPYNCPAILSFETRANTAFARLAAQQLSPSTP